MNKSDIVKSLSESQNIPLERAQKAVDFIFKSFYETLNKGERIEIRGFGSFFTREYPAYTGMNPKTGEKITVQAKKLPLFKPGKGLKERVNQGIK